MSPLQTQITDLPPATVVNDSDYTLIRQGLTDFKAEIGLIREIDISAFPLSNTPNPGDLMMVNRGGSNYSVTFDRVGFVTGTITWFYMAAPPSGWTLHDVQGDTLLAVVGGTGAYQQQGVRGNWRQSNHALTIEQIPAHSHRAFKTKDNTGSSNELGPVRGKTQSSDTFNTSHTGGKDSDKDHGSSSAITLGHNHGNTWRPRANVGILGRKLA